MAHSTVLALKSAIKTRIKHPLRRLRQAALAGRHRHDLTKLAQIFHTDKWGGDRYGPRGHW